MKVHINIRINSEKISNYRFTAYMVVYLSSLKYFTQKNWSSLYIGAVSLQRDDKEQC